MKRLLINLTIVISAAIMVSCGGDDPLPEPEVNFEASTSLGVFEIGQPILFINKTINASMYLWDFGDNTTSDEISPSHTYTEPGQYTVILTATTDDEQMSTSEITIAVGQRVLKQIDILGINFSRTDGTAWDEGSGPDIILFFGPDNDTQFENTIVTSPVPDLATPFQGLALGNVDNAPIDLSLTDEDWTIALLEDDSEIEANTVETMITAGFNPVQFAGAIVNSDSKQGIIQIALGGFDFVLVFEIE